MTTAAERTDAIIVQQQGERIARLIADVARLEKERDGLKLVAEQFGGDAADERKRAEQAEAQRDEAVGRFILAVNAEAEADMKRGNPLEGAHHRALEKLGEPFLIGLSTVTPECERVRLCLCSEHEDAYECDRHGCPWGECPATVPPLLTKGLREDGQ